jgi:hypothetical protein
MIKLYRAKKESRKRDLKRERFILEISDCSNVPYRIHLTPTEVRRLTEKGLKALGLTAVIYQVIK